MPVVNLKLRRRKLREHDSACRGFGVSDGEYRCRRIARNTAKLLDPSLEIPDTAVILDDRFHVGIYGIPGPGTIAAMKLCAREEAIITDPV